MIRPGLEPGAFCVLDRCDNQLRHRTLDAISLLDHCKLVGFHPVLNDANTEGEKLVQDTALMCHRCESAISSSQVSERTDKLYTEQCDHSHLSPC